MSESGGEGTVHGHSSDITVGRNRNSSKKVRRNHSVENEDDQAVVLLPCVEPLKGEGLSVGDCVDNDTTGVSVAHERLTGMVVLYLCMGVNLTDIYITYTCRDVQGLYTTSGRYPTAAKRACTPSYNSG